MRNFESSKAFLRARQNPSATTAMEMTYETWVSREMGAFWDGKVVKKIQVSCSTQSLLFDSFFLDKRDDYG